MTSIRPCLIRAVYEWAVDNDLTPLLLVQEEGVSQGGAQEKDQATIYNISPTAVRDLVVDEESVRFQARFQGMLRHVDLDLRTVLRVYCRENNEGLWFPLTGDPHPSPTDGQPTPAKSRPNLTVVK